MRLIVSAAVLAEMKKLRLTWPKLPKDQLAVLAHARQLLMSEE
jgi:hypothetical protein